MSTLNRPAMTADAGVGECMICRRDILPGERYTATLGGTHPQHVACTAASLAAHDRRAANTAMAEDGFAGRE